MRKYAINNCSDSMITRAIDSANTTLQYYINKKYNEVATTAGGIVLPYINWVLDRNKIKFDTESPYEDRIDLLESSQPVEMLMEIRAVWRRAEFFRENVREKCKLLSARHSMHVVNYCMMSMANSCYEKISIDFLREEIDKDLANEKNSFIELEHESELLIKNFYKNAKRAERYLYLGDFYINMACTRMAVECFVNYCLRDENLQSETTIYEKTLSEKLFILGRKTGTDRSSMDDTRLVVRRGNNCVHSSKSAYYFSARHNVDLLIACKNKLVGDLQLHAGVVEWSKMQEEKKAKLAEEAKQAEISKLAEEAILAEMSELTETEQIGTSKNTKE